MLYVLLFVLLKKHLGEEIVLVCRHGSEINLKTMRLFSVDPEDHYAIAVGEQDPTDNSTINNTRRIMSEKLGLNLFNLKRSVKPDKPIIVETNDEFTVVAVLAPNEALKHITTKTSAGGLYPLIRDQVVHEGNEYAEKIHLTSEILNKAFGLVFRSL